MRTVVSRRHFLSGSVAAAVAASLPVHARMGRGAIAASSGSGFYPSGHWIAAKQAMVQIYPRPDAETSANARHHWAYYDGTNAIEYSVPIGIAFGTYPYVVTSFTGPSWLSVGTIYGSSNYLRVYGTPTGSYSGTVSLTIEDQQHNSITISWALATSSSTAHFVFVDFTNGNDTNNGAIGTPYKTIAGAFGSTYGTVVNAGANCYVRGNATAYQLPLYTDGNMSLFTHPFGIQTANKPISLMAYPGESVTFDTSGTAGTASHFVCYDTTSDIFLQGFTCSGYDSGLTNFSLVNLLGNSNTINNRFTIDQVSWTGAGYGSVGTDNASMVVSNDAGAGVFKQYVYLRETSESGRTSGTPGNNFAGCDFYSCTNVLVENCTASNPSGSCDAAFFLKSDIQNGCVRGAFVHFVNALECFGGEQAIHGNWLNNEYCYNTVVGGNISNPHGTTGPSGAGWAYRNSVVAASGQPGMLCNDPNPFINVNLGGTVTSGDAISLTFTNTGLAGFPVTVSYTATGADTLSTIATALKNAINGNTTLTAANISATTASAQIKVTQAQIPSVATGISGSVSGSATETIGFAPYGSTLAIPGPFYFESNAVQTATTPMPPTGSAIHSDGLNIAQSTGMLDTTTGQFLSSYLSGNPGALGTVGAQIA